MLSAIIVVLVFISSLRFVDQYSDSYTSKAIQQAAISYATARGLNALVSMLQTSTIEGDAVVVSGSLSVGQVLDPLNDLIERFSSVMTVVLVSLAGQKALLLVSSHTAFLYLLAALGAATVLSLFLGGSRTFEWVFKFFLIVVVIRFALGVAVAANGLVDNLFFWEQTGQYDRNIELFREEMDNGSGQASESLVNNLKTWLSGISLSEIEAKVRKGVSDFMSLMAIYMLKTILFPLLFFYLFVAVIRKLWRMRIGELLH